MAGEGLSIRQKKNPNVRFPTQLTKDSVLGAALVLLPRLVEKDFRGASGLAQVLHLPTDGGNLYLGQFYQTRYCVTASTCPGALRLEWSR